MEDEAVSTKSPKDYKQITFGPFLVIFLMKPSLSQITFDLM